MQMDRENDRTDRTARAATFGRTRLFSVVMQSLRHLTDTVLPTLFNFRLFREKRPNSWHSGWPTQPSLSPQLSEILGVSFSPFVDLCQLRFYCHPYFSRASSTVGLNEFFGQSACKLSEAHKLIIQHHWSLISTQIQSDALTLLHCLWVATENST